MNHNDEFSDFVPDERSSEEDISSSSDKVRERLLNDVTLRTMLDSVFDMILILDHNRQSVHANKSLLNFLKLDNSIPILGLRPGEIFRCIHSHGRRGGCGMTKYCELCGVVKAINSALSDNQDIQECSIICDNGGAFDFEITSSKITIDEMPFVFFVMSDISDRKRREVLERIFFHDVLNLSGVIWGYAEFLKDGHIEKSQELGSKIYVATRKLVDEIQYQRNLLSAERNDLSMMLQEVHSLDVVKETAALYVDHTLAKNITIEVDKNAQDVVLTSDTSLLHRVFGNMLKNALEASGDGDVVTLGCKKQNDRVEFWVHNRAFIPEKTQRQIFNRSFSTRGAGRGLGTYSIKLISEHYLKGRVSFESSERGGTTFKAEYPLNADFNR